MNFQWCTLVVVFCTKGSSSSSCQALASLNECVIIFNGAECLFSPSCLWCAITRLLKQTKFSPSLFVSLIMIIRWSRCRRRRPSLARTLIEPSTRPGVVFTQSPPRLWQTHNATHNRHEQLLLKKYTPFFCHVFNHNLSYSFPFLSSSSGGCDTYSSWVTKTSNSHLSF